MKKRSQYIIVTIIALILTSVSVWHEITISYSGCLNDDPKVLGTARTFQGFFAVHARFPDQNAVDMRRKAQATEDGTILKAVWDQYDIHTFSNAGIDDFFVYFKNDCKLRIRPASHDVFPRNP